MRKSCFCFYPGFASEGYYEAVLQHLLDWKMGCLCGVRGKVSHFLIAALCSQGSSCRLYLSLQGHLLSSIQLLLQG